MERHNSIFAQDRGVGALPHDGRYAPPHSMDVHKRRSPGAPLRFTYESLTGTFLATPRAEQALVIG